jgi:hypothetical protein
VAIVGLSVLGPRDFRFAEIEVDLSKLIIAIHRPVKMEPRVAALQSAVVREQLRIWSPYISDSFFVCLDLLIHHPLSSIMLRLLCLSKCYRKNKEKHF